jgi:hypothetical protein
VNCDGKREFHGIVLVFTDFLLIFQCLKKCCNALNINERN